MTSLLLVDDEELVCKEFKVFLEKKSYKVQTAQNALEALRQFRASPPDIVLTDYLMPEMDGLELLRELKALRDDVPVVLMSGHADMRTAVTFLKEDAFDFLRKPIDSKELLTVISLALQRKEEADLPPTVNAYGPIVHTLTGQEKGISLLEINCGLDERSRGRLENALSTLIQEGTMKKKVIVSFRNSDYINNVGLNFLIDMDKRFKQTGHSLVLTQVPRKILDYLKMLGYTQYFRVILNLDEALMELRS